MPTNNIPNEAELNMQLGAQLRAFVEEFGFEELEKEIHQIYGDHLRICKEECPQNEHFTFFLVMKMVKLFQLTENSIVQAQKAA